MNAEVRGNGKGLGFPTQHKIRVRQRLSAANSAGMYPLMRQGLAGRLWQEMYTQRVPESRGLSDV